MHLDADTFRIINACLALAIVFALAAGLVAGWRHMIIWRWLLVAVLVEHAVLAYANLDASQDSAMPHGNGYLPLRVMLLAVANCAVLLTAILATVSTRLGNLETPSGHRVKPPG